MYWICSKYHGDLQVYINSCQKMKLELDAYIEVLTLNDKIIEKPDLISRKNQEFVKKVRIQTSKQEPDPSSQNQNYKITYYCTNGTSSLEANHQLIVDCGATHHMFNNQEHFSTINTIPCIKVALSAEGIGSVSILCKGASLTLKNFFFIPKLTCNLRSIKRDGSKQPHDFELHSAKSSHHSEHQKPLAPLTWTSWFAISQNNGTSRQAHLPLDCIHIDFVRPISPMSVSGCLYFLTIVDQATSFKNVKLIKNNSEALNQFFIAKKAMENLHDNSLKKLVSDQGGEFMNNQFTQLAESQCFVNVFSHAKTPQHNGFAERSNQFILEKARCLLNSSNLPNCYWAEAINTSNFLCKIVPTLSRHNLSPYVLCRGLPPRIKWL
ncbi:hypothetical protein O181_020825 [Austropuccinia psidii MF-1]|uniref:Integrase catalytic domain-containing protein n=1 Tax=Austropuccinia psidii MF-1 TaxID=1389203 RepID=A0A9Q3CEI5_9BASI|nr:hypothetical protein [Austropuccinia psidii MF-1]